MAEALLLVGAPVVGRLRGGAGLILAYHNIVPDDARARGDRSLHIGRAAFARHLDEVLARARIVPLPELIAATPTRSDSRPRIAITFDDAYAGMLDAGVAELARRGLPATVFVAPEFIGGRSFWWDDLAAADASGLPATVRERALDEWQGRDAVVRDRAAAEGMSSSPDAHPAYVGGTEAQLRAATEQGITLGAHTWSHPNLTRIDPATLRSELARPLAWLHERFPGATIPWLAYPYGLENDAVRRAAAAAGYEGALRVDGGWIRGREDRFALPRLNVPAGLSRTGLALRLARVLG